MGAELILQARYPHVDTRLLDSEVWSYKSAIRCEKFGADGFTAEQHAFKKPHRVNGAIKRTRLQA
jgi:hypothetical protein